MNTPQLVVHGHFYQPPRLDPFTGTMPRDPTAAPAHDWNERVDADCYRPNARLGNLGAISWDLGPTLAAWLADDDPPTFEAFVRGDADTNGMAQPFHHTILPLGSAADRRTEIRWGMRDFEVRFGRRPTGMWLPETAVDLATLRLIADEGIDHTILAPWQVAQPDVETRRPVRIDLGDGRSTIVALYDGLLSAAVSFEPDATIDADAFVRDRLVPRFVEPGLDDGETPLVIIATDGELYGHHRPEREHFLARLVGSTAPASRPFETVALPNIVRAAVASGMVPTAILHERTSWSCHHGVGRWASDCGCVPDGGWKAPLRSAFDRLAGAIDGLTEQAWQGLGAASDPWTARDAYVDVVIGLEAPSAFASRVLGHGGATETATLAALMEAQRWRLAMFASCAWFWEDPVRPETAAALRSATRAARLVDGLEGTGLEARLAADLAMIRGPGGETGGTILAAALAAVGQRVGG